MKQRQNYKNGYKLFVPSVVLGLESDILYAVISLSNNARTYSRKTEYSIFMASVAP